MLLEALVIGICAQGYDGCSQSTSAYYQQSKELQQVSKNVEEYGKKITDNNSWIIYFATPAYAIASRRPAKVLIYRGTTFNVDIWHQSVGLQWSY
jgi:hypothetical protein